MKVLIGLSGGINSMAVLCWLAEQPDKPEELHLIYHHFAEHSPDTFQFVADGIRFARQHFHKVLVKITSNSILKYFEENKFIPHELKRRVNRQVKNEKKSLFSAYKSYPIGEFTDDWCFEIVDKYIGWHPFIYDIKDENGKRIFTHIPQILK